MITFITGRAGYGKTTYVEKMIQDDVENGIDVVLIVPEQQAVVRETSLSSLLPASANLKLEITNFTRLANSVFRQYGGLSETVVDAPLRSLLVWKAMQLKKSSLKLYSDDSAVIRLMSVIDELKCSGISPDDTREALDSLLSDSEGTCDLFGKLSDIYEIYESYEELLESSGIDRNDLYSKLAETLAANPYFREKNVYIDSFFSLTAPEKRILEEIMKQAKNLTITFACPHEDSGEIQFGEIRRFLSECIRAAESAGRQVDYFDLTVNRRLSGDAVSGLAAAERAFLDYSAVHTSGSPDGISILSCSDINEEAEACASVIGSCLHRGYKCSDIAVVARSMSGRESITDAALRKRGIPCFLSGSTGISSSPAVRFVETALAAVYDWRSSTILEFIKTGLTPLDEAAEENLVGNLQIYMKTWNIRGRRSFLSEWTMNPDGYKTELTENGKLRLDAVNRARSLFVPALDRFVSVFDANGASAADICTGIVTLADELRLCDGLERLAKTYESLRLSADAARVRKSWDYVCGLLDRIVRVNGDMKLNIKQFLSVFRTAARQMDSGTIPTAIDEVLLGSASDVRFDEKKVVILLGSTDSEFPGTVRNSGSCFSESDKIRLEGAGLSISSPDAEVLTSREYFMYYRTAFSASEKLYILVPGKNPSEPAKRIQKITGAEIRKFSSLPLEEIIWHPADAEYMLSHRTGNAERAFLRSLIPSSKNRIPLTAENDSMSEDMPESLTLSQAKIDSFVSCPFSYAMGYIIKAEQEPETEFSAADFGNAVHYVLEKFFRGMTENDYRSLPMSEDEINSRIDDYISEYRTKIGAEDHNGRLDYTFGLLRRRLRLAMKVELEIIERGVFRPVAFEKPLGGGIELITSQGCPIRLTGTADRIDRFVNGNCEYLFITDYKTGDRKFKDQNITEGQDLQLPIYLFSFCESGIGGDRDLVRIPAGAMYLPLFNSPSPSDYMVSVAEAENLTMNTIKHTGILNSDDNIPDLLFGTVEEFEKIHGPRTSRQKSDPRFSCTPSDGETIGCLQENVFSIIEEIGTRILCGNANATVSEASCKYCSHAEECRLKGISNA